MPYFHCSSTILEPGSIIMPGNWGRIIRTTGWAHQQALREATFEYVRQQEFPGKPSRLESLFFFEDEDEALFYANSDGRHAMMLTYEIEVIVPQAAQHVGDWRGLEPRHPIVDLSWVRNYWAGQMLPPHQIDGNRVAACREIVAVTPARILRRL